MIHPVRQKTRRISRLAGQSIRPLIPEDGLSSPSGGVWWSIRMQEFYYDKCCINWIL